MLKRTWKFLAHLLLLISVATAPAMAQPAPPPTGPLDKSEKQAVVARAGDLLVAHYVFPDRAVQAKAKIDTALTAGEYDQISDATAFADRLTADLQSVTHDKHMRVMPAPTGGPPPLPTTAPPPPTTQAGFARVDRLKGNIGYIKVLGFPPPGPFNMAADEAMASLAGTAALIIDMRDNGGGSPETVSYLCSFFFDPNKPVHLNSLIFRKEGTNEFATTEFRTRPTPTSFLGKPVYILTSSRTFSGGEEFVNDLKVQKRATVVGAITGGGANPGGGWPLGPRFGMFIPTGRAENPVTKTSWEGIGVIPDMKVDEAMAFRAAALDIIQKRRGGNGNADLMALKAQLAQQSAVDPFVEQKLLKIRTTALPNGAAAARRLVEELASGKPNYGLMSEGLAGATRQQLPNLQADMSKLGPIQSITFKTVTAPGLDAYEVLGTNGGIYLSLFVSPNGMIETAVIRPKPAGPPPPTPGTAP